MHDVCGSLPSLRGTTKGDPADVPRSNTLRLVVLWFNDVTIHGYEFRSRRYSRAYLAAYRSLLSSEETNHSANLIGIFIAVPASHLVPRSFLNGKGIISACSEEL